MPPCCLEAICRGTASSGGQGSLGGCSAAAGGGCAACGPSKARLCWERNRERAKPGAAVGNTVECCAGAEASLGEHRAFATSRIWPGGPKKFCLYFNRNVWNKEKEQIQESDSPVAAPGLLCAGAKAQPWPGLGGPREPGRRQDPLQPLWGGSCPTPSPSSLPPSRCQARPWVRGTGVEGQDGHGSCWHALQPLKPCAHKGLCCWAASCSPSGYPLSPSSPSHPPLPVPRAPQVVLLPYLQVLPTHIPHRGPGCALVTSSGTSPTFSSFFQAQI